MGAKELLVPPAKPEGSAILAGGANHRHTWQYASVLIQSRQHPITGQVAQIPTVLMTCGCGDLRHVHIPEPIVLVDLTAK